jgi:chemotaxis protein CheD
MSKAPQDGSVGTGTGEVHVLHPGDVVCAERGDRMETLLGSCVAIILTDPRRTVGAMCHIVHSGPASSATSASGAHADVALATLYGLLRERGLEPTQCEAYVYGGGNMFPDIFMRTHVGDDNAQWVLAALAEDGVPVLIDDVGGNTYRRLAWTVGPGLPHVIAVPI